MKYLLDTNIFLYHLAGHPAVEYLFSDTFANQNSVYTSRIVRIELLSFTKLTAIQEKAIESLLSKFILLPVNAEIEEVTIYLRRRYKLKLPDALILASAFTISSTLISNNTNDFKHISEIKIETPIRKK